MTNFGLSQNSDFQKISYSYTKSGLLESSANQFGGKISYEFDDFGTPKQIENQYGKKILSYTKSGLPKKVIDGEGFETTYTYNLTPKAWTVFPLSDGSGAYQVKIFQNHEPKSPSNQELS